MELNNDQLELLEKIDKYIAGELSDEDTKTFELRIEEDADLKKEVEANRAVNFAIQHKDKKQLKDDLVEANSLINNIREKVTVEFQTSETTSQTEKPAKEASKSFVDQLIAFLVPRAPMLRPAIAALIVLAIAIPGYLFFQPVTTENLYADNFKPYHNVLTPASRSAEQELTELQKLMLLYEQKDYNIALGEFNEYIDQHPEEGGLRFYRAIIFMELDDLEKAIADLEYVMDNNRSLAGQAKWYMALTYLKDNRPEDAFKVLEEISGSGNPYSQQAAEILKQIN